MIAVRHCQRISGADTRDACTDRHQVALQPVYFRDEVLVFKGHAST